jgi:NHL repeat/6-bladed beta-propeller
MRLRDARHLAVFILIAQLAPLGCARPSGVMFPQISPSRVWPPPPDAPRIRLVGTLSGSDDLNAAESGKEAFASLMRGPRPPIRFSTPNAIAVSETSVLAIADGSAAAVHIVDLTTREHTLVGGWSEERLEMPVGVAWVGRRLFVSDAKRHEIIELTEVGGFVRRFGENDLMRPVGIAFVRESDTLYVVDGGEHRLAVFDLGGALRKTIGHRGEAPGEFNYPSHLFVRGGRLVVADSGNFRVQVLDLAGNVIRTIGQKGNGAGDFALPKGVAIDNEGHVFVVDAQFENVQVFDQTGQLLIAFGREGRSPGEFWLPSGLTIDDQNRIWVADSGNRRIQLFEQVRTSS